MDGNYKFTQKPPSVPESVTVRSKEDLYEKLDEAMRQIKQGQVMDADAVMARLREKYGFSESAKAE